MRNRNFRMYGCNSGCNMRKMHTEGLADADELAQLFSGGASSGAGSFANDAIDFSESERQELISLGFDPDKIRVGNLSEDKLEILAKAGFNTDFLRGAPLNSNSIESNNQGISQTDVFNALNQGVNFAANLTKNIIDVTKQLDSLKRQQDSAQSQGNLQQVQAIQQQIDVLKKQNQELQAQNIAFRSSQQVIAPVQEKNIFTPKNIAIGAGIVIAAGVTAWMFRRPVVVRS